MAKISDRLDYEILDCGISKVKLAKEIGVSRDLVICVFHMICTGMERGNKCPTEGTLLS